MRSQSLQRKKGSRRIFMVLLILFVTLWTWINQGLITVNLTPSKRLLVVLLIFPVWMRISTSMLVRRSTARDVMIWLFNSGKITLSNGYQLSELIIILWNIILYYRSSKKTVGKTCRGFFNHPDHLANHFSHLTSAPNLKESVGRNLKLQIGEINFAYNV